MLNTPLSNTGASAARPMFSGRITDSELRDLLVQLAMTLGFLEEHKDRWGSLIIDCLRSEYETMIHCARMRAVNCEYNRETVRMIEGVAPLDPARKETA